MTLPYKRNFNIGRQSEQFFNEQLHIIFEALKNINYRKNENRGEEPGSIVDGGLWFDKVDEALKYFDIKTQEWIPVFSKKFQITDNILNVTMPANPITGQLWIYNGVLMYFDGSQWQPIKAILQEESQWSNAAFENFMIVTPLNAMDNVVVGGSGEDYDKLIETIRNWKGEDHTNTNYIVPVSKKWGEEGFKEPEIDGPDAPINIPEEIKSQFVVPDLNTDRIFVGNLLNTNYEEVSKVCIQYPTKDIYNQTVSCVHLNPNKLSKITKRLVKVNKLNSTIEIPAYNTEFYGFRHGEYGGDFLIESQTQDYGDYIPDGDHIILNYEATQNYDYILAVTYEFNSYRSDGSVASWEGNDSSKSFYLTNLQEPINVHVEGLKLEEAAYDIDFVNKTVTINDEDAPDDIHVQMWSPYKKQFGYIRETDLEGNGIIKLLRKVTIPLVFVGGTLIHPLYGGLKFENDKIIIPNHTGIDSMKNLAWCVVDLYNQGTEYMYSEKGYTSKQEASFVMGEEDYLDGQGNFIMHGSLTDTIDEDGFRDFILASGVISGANAIGIHYDNTRIGKDDGIILFVEGLMIPDEEIVRDHANGMITLKSIQLKENMEYVLLRDHDKRLYTTSNMIAAFATGLFGDSLVYLNGQLLANENCVTTTSTETDEIANGVVNNEIKYFIPDEFSQDKGTWKIYDEWTYNWNDLSEEEIEWVKLIVSSYSNQLTSVKINVEYDEDDELKIYTFKLTTSLSGVLKLGDCSYVETDVDDGLQVWKTGSDAWAYGQKVLNIFCNGVKLTPNMDYRELSENNYIKMLYPLDLNDRVTYIIEPIESGETYGHKTIIMGPESAVHPNIYQVGDSDDTPDLYPGRLTVYINGIRIPNEDWTLLDNKRIMLKYNNYQAIGSSDNYPTETYLDGNRFFEVKHNYPDYIMVEIRKDYDRQEVSFEINTTDNMELYLDDYPIDSSVLEATDEVLFYLNGQFVNLSRNNSQDYKLDKYKGCIAFQNSDFISAINIDPLQRLFNTNALIYSAWKEQTGKDSYESPITNRLTIVWR